MKMCAQDIEFTLIRSDRKTADIVIERSGDVFVRAPMGVCDEKVREVVANRAMWVHRSLAEWEELNSSRRHRPLVQGQGFAYLGRSYRLKFVTESEVPLKLKNGRWELSEQFLAQQDDAAVRKAFRDYYTMQGQRIFAERGRFARRDCGKGAGLSLGVVWHCGSAEFSLENANGSANSD
jgi:predicted metal-dependent hydrolase